jgi:hypothetical protein
MVTTCLFSSLGRPPRIMQEMRYAELLNASLVDDGNGASPKK